MAQDTVLQIVRDACSEIGITQPNTAVGATDLQIIQLTSLVNREGRELSQRGQWQELVKEQTWTSLAAEDQGAINGGLYQKKADFPAQYPSVVIGVDDLERSMRAVREAGGQVLGTPMEIPEVGLYVSFLDTEGNRNSMLQPKRGGRS